MWLLKIFLLTFFAFAKADSVPESTLDWWQKSVVYQIYPRSFKDSNSDGIGDLKGIEEKLEYLKDLGIDIIWLSPIFKSPMADMGYDISDFKAIDPIFGTMSDFESLLNKTHSLGLKLTLDFVPNHSSDEHEWFVKSINKIDPYTDYYVWKDPKGWVNETTPIPPNNWVGPFELSTWTYHPDRKQFYLHHFAIKQPDLNYRCKELLEEMKNVIRFWLDKGVDGFRMDAVPFLVEDDRFLDQPLISNELINGKPAYRAFNYTYTQCQPETYHVLRQFREVVDSYKEKDGQTRLIMTEAYATIENTMKFYGNKTHPIAHIPFNFNLLGKINHASSTMEYQNAINEWMNNMPEGKWANWVLGNHDTSRIANRFDPNAVDAINMLLLLLPGTPVTFNGEEIGMEDTKIRWDQTTDVGALVLGPLLYNTNNRDPERTPFQWDSSSHAGFSRINGRTWLPANPNYYRVNVENQKNNPRSHYNNYKTLIKLRSNEVFRRGDLKMYNASTRVFVFERSLQNERYLNVMNVNNEEEVFNLKNIIPDTTGKFKIVFVSDNSEHEVGKELSTSNYELKMRPKSAVVLQGI